MLHPLATAQGPFGCCRESTYQTDDKAIWETHQTAAMASPEWFFSTLAQSSAAIIGFVLAFSAVLHQLERQQREKRTDTLRDELVDLRENYGYLMTLIGEMFSMIVGGEFVKFNNDEPTDFGQILNKEAMDLIDDFEENPEIDLPYSMLCGLYFSTISRKLGKIEPAEAAVEDYLISERDFKETRAAANGLMRLIETAWFESPELAYELNPDIEEEESSGNTMRRRVFGYPDDKIGVGPNIFPSPDSNEFRDSARFEETVASEIRKWGKRTLHESDENEADFNGKNLFSLESVVVSFWVGFQKVDAHRNNTLLDYEPTVSGNIIKGSAFLALTGVFTPIALLLTLPQNTQFDALSGWSLTLVQAVVLGLSAISTAYLLFIILKNLDGTWTGLHLTERLRSRISDRKN